MVTHLGLHGILQNLGHFTKSRIAQRNHKFPTPACGSYQIGKKSSSSVSKNGGCSTLKNSIQVIWFIPINFHHLNLDWFLNHLENLQLILYMREMSAQTQQVIVRYLLFKNQRRQKKRLKVNMNSIFFKINVIDVKSCILHVIQKKSDRVVQLQEKEFLFSGINARYQTVWPSRKKICANNLPFSIVFRPMISWSS